MAIYREIGDRSDQVNALNNIGAVLASTGCHEMARQYLRQSLQLAQQQHQRSAEAEAYNGLGEAELAAGRPDEAVAAHLEALACAHAIGYGRQQARAHRGIAEALHAVGRPAQAREHWQHALQQYENLGVPEARSMMTARRRVDTRGR